MSEPETQGEHVGAWAPPTGAPAPRPDPYARFGNPLHDTWGTSTVRPAEAPRAVKAPKAWRKRPLLRWAVAAGVLAVVAVGGWLNRDKVVDTWNRVYDKAAEVTGDEAATDDAGSDAAAATTKSVDERLAEVEAAKDEAFDDWMRANRDELSAAVDRMDSLNGEMVVIHQALDAGGTPDLNERRGAIAEAHDATLATAQLLDTAPESAIRNDFVTVLLLQAGESGKMIEAVDAKDTAGARTASQRLQRVSAEVTRLCRQYGDEAAALCE